jgi:hypothetical protein
MLVERWLFYTPNIHDALPRSNGHIVLAFIHAKYPRYPSTYVKHTRFHLVYAKRPRYKSIVRLVTSTLFSQYCTVPVLDDMRT